MGHQCPVLSVYVNNARGYQYTVNNARCCQYLVTIVQLICHKHRNHLQHQLLVISTHLFCSETHSALFVHYEQSASLKPSFAWSRFSISRADYLPHDGIHSDTFFVLPVAHRRAWSWHSITSIVLTWMFSGVNKFEQMYRNVVHLPIYFLRY